MGERQNRTLEVEGSNPSGSTIALIPARWASSRFPGKILHPILGKPLLQWVFEHLQNIPNLTVYVATDDPRVAHAVQSWGGHPLLTPSDLPSGTDRIAYALQTYNIHAPYILNVQADEPLLNTQILTQFLHTAFTQTPWDLATLTTTFSSHDELHSPHTVKVVTDIHQNALYFSRSVIPYPRTPLPLTAYRKHVGVYLYQRNALLRLVQSPQAPPESAEMLEQLRALYYGMRIRVVHLPNLRLQAVDVPEDVPRVEAILRSS